MMFKRLMPLPINAMKRTPIVVRGTEPSHPQLTFTDDDAGEHCERQVGTTAGGLSAE